MSHATIGQGNYGTIARECGYGLYHIDLLLERARLHLLRGDAGAALDDIEVALDTGIPANDETGQVELLAANHEECGYAWAIPAGLQLRAEALPLQAAQQFGSDSFAPARINQLPTEVAVLIEQAKALLQEALGLWQPLHDPEPERDDQNFKLDGKEYNYKAEETWKNLQDLAGGILTRYPLEPVVVGEENEKDRVTPSKPRESLAMKKHVFLSYCRDNRDEVGKLRDDLLAAGEAVWWDQDILGGQDWKMEIRKAMRDAYAVVVCLSRETADRVTSGVYPEVLDAIAAYREQSPGGIFLIPVRLSKCEIPMIEIDGTRTLDRLNYIDLFEAGGLDKLIQSIQASSLHP